ncbi:unnamed protein product [Colias eurytheme]|nr:unnamed protein product [Colias eurytheme]
MILSSSFSQGRCTSNCVVDDVSSDWKTLYNSQLWSNSGLRREIINKPFIDNKAIKCCYTCRGKIRNYEITSPSNSFLPGNHSTPKVNNTSKESVNSIRDINEIQLRYTSQDNVSVASQEGNEPDIRSIPSISREVDKSFRQKYISAAYNSNADINIEQRRLRKSLKGIRCIFRVALTESPTKKRTQIKACSISVMIVAIVMISLVLVNLSTPSLLREMNKNSTMVVPTINIAVNETSSAIVSITDPLTTDTIDVTQSSLAEESTGSTSATMFISKPNQTVSTVIAKIRKNIKTYPKIKNIHSNGTKDIINRDLSQKFCSCQNNEVCMLDEDTGTSVCKIAVDIDDPTGCGGLCALETEACQLVDKERGIRVCRLITYETCSPEDWRCRNGLCVPSSARCDGSIQCYDRSDEKQCDCDLTKEFRCGHSLSCFPNKKICDGVIDCWDGFDEVNCTMECPEGHSPCNDGQCIMTTRFCDGFSDCTDGSDEPQGCDSACGTHELRCMNRRCVPQLSQCDGRDDCGDNTDEMHCS